GRRERGGPRQAEADLSQAPGSDPRGPALPAALQLRAARRGEAGAGQLQAKQQHPGQKVEHERVGVEGVDPPRETRDAPPAPRPGPFGRTGVMLAVARLAAAVGVVLATALLDTAAAQPAENVARVGYISPGSSADPFRLRRFEAFRQGLRELGYVEGRNVVLEPRWAEGKYEQYPALAADLVRLKVRVIVTVGGAATRAARQTRTTTPIVMSVVIDPVGSGLRFSLAHPRGNLTGPNAMASDIVREH